MIQYTYVPVENSTGRVDWEGARGVSFVAADLFKPSNELLILGWSYKLAKTTTELCSAEET